MNKVSLVFKMLRRVIVITDVEKFRENVSAIKKSDTASEGNFKSFDIIKGFHNCLLFRKFRIFSTIVWLEE